MLPLSKDAVQNDQMFIQENIKSMEPTHERVDSNFLSQYRNEKSSPFTLSNTTAIQLNIL